MITKRDIHVALSFSIINVLELRFINYTNWLGLAKNPYYSLIISILIFFLSLCVLKYKKGTDFKSEVSFIALYIAFCTTLNFIYQIFIKPLNLPPLIIIFQSLVLFAIASVLTYAVFAFFRALIKVISGKT
jgi:hypothetical protein